MMLNNILKEGILRRLGLNGDIPYEMTTLIPNNIDEMLKLQSEVIEGKGFNISWFYPFCYDELKEILNEKDNLVIGIFTDEGLIAFRVGCINGNEFREISQALGGKYEAGEAMLLNGVFVKESYRGNHLQQVMSQYTIDECTKRGIRTLMTAIHPDNSASIKSLENIGFERKKRAMLYGGKYDRVILVKEND